MNIQILFRYQLIQQCCSSFCKDPRSRMGIIQHEDNIHGLFIVCRGQRQRHLRLVVAVQRSRCFGFGNFPIPLAGFQRLDFFQLDDVVEGKLVVLIHIAGRTIQTPSKIQLQRCIILQTICHQIFEILVCLFIQCRTILILSNAMCPCKIQIPRIRIQPFNVFFTENKAQKLLIKSIIGGSCQFTFRPFYLHIKLISIGLCIYKLINPRVLLNIAEQFRF